MTIGNNNKVTTLGRCLSNSTAVSKKSIGSYLSKITPSGRRENHITKAGMSIYDSLRWYHGTTRVSKIEIENPQKGGFKSLKNKQLSGRVTSSGTYVSKDLAVAFDYGWGDMARRINPNRNVAKDEGGIARLFGTADDHQLIPCSEFDYFAKDVRMTHKKELPLEYVLTDNEPSPTIKQCFYQHMQKEIKDITLKESNACLMRVKSFSGDDYERGKNAIQKRGFVSDQRFL